MSRPHSTDAQHELFASAKPSRRDVLAIGASAMGFAGTAAGAGPETGPAADAQLNRGRGNRDFFVLKTAVAAAYSTLQKGGLDVSQFGKPYLDTRPSDHLSSSQGQAILALQRNLPFAREPEKCGLKIVPFPHSAVSLVNLALDPTANPVGMFDCFNFLIPRATFDQLADNHAADRIVELALKPGAAANDPIVLHLGNCLIAAIERYDGANDQFVDRVTTALNIHLARVYGGMNFPRPLVNGGLTPWQLRLVRNTINANLEGKFSLEQIARECKLSVSHFARAFARSTGISLHRWLMQRRVDVAKDLMLTTDSSLVEISLRCGFSDQSHFTRVFAEATGETPGRWRQIQLN